MPAGLTDAACGVVSFARNGYEAFAERIQMSEGWTSIGAVGRECADAVIAGARSSLAAAGFPVHSRRFPFAMHHDVYRVRLPRLPGGARPRHADVARLLNAWAAGRSDPADYAWQAIEGAIREMVGKNQDLAPKVPIDVRTGIDSVGGGTEFIEWASREVSAGET